MKIEKILKGTFEPTMPGTAEDFSKFLIERGYKFSVSESQKFSVSFDVDAEYEEAVSVIMKFEETNNPQTSLELDE